MARRVGAKIIIIYTLLSVNFTNSESTKVTSQDDK